MQLKVADLGLSKFTSSSKQTTTMGLPNKGLGSALRYMAPELMMVDVDGRGPFDHKVDIYSAASILWFMCVGEHPFGDLPSETVVAGVCQGLRPDLYSVQRRNGRELADCEYENLCGFLWISAYVCHVCGTWF
jgi:serine/threonine protein kinase